MMNNNKKKILLAAVVGLTVCSPVCLTSCRSHYAVTSAEITRVPIDKSVTADAEALQLIAPYRGGVDSMMNHVLGHSEMMMDRTRPESPLGNLIAEVLRLSGSKVLGHPADFAVMNVGGIRRELEAGDITMAEAFEILPFENSLCVLTMTGQQVKKVLSNISQRGGEAISGGRITIDGHGGFSDATIQGQPIDDNHLYTIATIDYLAEGNDGMTGLLEFEDKVCPEGMTLRSLFIEWVQQQTAQGRTVSATIDGRLKIQDNK